MKAEERERQRRRRDGQQGSGKVEEKEEEEAKGNLACGFGNFIMVFCDLLWFLTARYPFFTIIIIVTAARLAMSGSLWKEMR